MHLPLRYLKHHREHSKQKAEIKTKEKYWGPKFVQNKCDLGWNPVLLNIIQDEIDLLNTIWDEIDRDKEVEVHKLKIKHQVNHIALSLSLFTLSIPYEHEADYFWEQ